MSFFKWSRTAASNATADTSINWSEGQAPSSVNDSGRAMMAASSKYRDDISGAIVTGGTSTAYTVTSYQTFDTLANMNGQIIAFTPHTTNGATVTLNVDGLGAKALRSAPNVELLAGTLIQGTPYLALYSNADAAWYLHGFYGNPYNIPLAGGLDYWAPTAPNSSFVFPIGQAISRVTYAALFAAMGTTYGTGDGSTTFNLPDKTGRTSVMKEAIATRLTATYFGGNSTSLGATGGLESNNVLLTHNHTLTDPGHNHTTAKTSLAIVIADAGSANFTSGPYAAPAVANNSSTTGITIASAGTASAHNIVQPTIVCNYIMRII